MRGEAEVVCADVDAVSGRNDEDVALCNLFQFDVEGLFEGGFEFGFEFCPRGEAEDRTVQLVIAGL